MSEILLQEMNYDAWNIVAWISFLMPIGSLVTMKKDMPCVAGALMAAQDLVHIIFRTVATSNDIFETTNLGYQSFFNLTNMGIGVYTCLAEDDILEQGTYDANLSKLSVFLIKTSAILQLIITFSLGLLERLASGLGSFLFEDFGVDFTVLDASSTFNFGSFLNAIAVLVMF